MTLHANDPITPDNIKLLRAGDVICHTREGYHYIFDRMVGSDPETAGLMVHAPSGVVTSFRTIGSRAFEFVRRHA